MDRLSSPLYIYLRYPNLLSFLSGVVEELDYFLAHARSQLEEKLKLWKQGRKNKKKTKGNKKKKQKIKETGLLDARHKGKEKEEMEKEGQKDEDEDEDEITANDYIYKVLLPFLANLYGGPFSPLDQIPASTSDNMFLSRSFSIVSGLNSKQALYTCL